MKMLLRSAPAIALLIALAAPAHAQVRLSIANGRVTLFAQNVTVKEILAEWARVGQTTIVNAEKLAGPPVTIELDNVPEAQALDSVLRSAAGYVMAPRAPGAPGASVYDRILILASSRPPAVVATPPPFGGRPMPQARRGPQDEEQQDDNAFEPPPWMNGPQGGPAFAPQPAPMTQQGPGPMIQQGPGPTTQQAPGPMTAPRPGPLPQQQPANVAPAAPYLGTPPGPTAPTFNPSPPPPNMEGPPIQ
jgi:hypothetical protein